MNLKKIFSIFVALMIISFVGARTINFSASAGDGVYEEYTLKSTGKVTASADAMIEPFEQGDVTIWVIYNSEDVLLDCSEFGLGDFDSTTEYAEQNFTKGTDFIVSIYAQNGNGYLQLTGDF